jgi:hypothetical protein
MAAVVTPAARRLRERPYGSAEAFAACAVAVCLTMTAVCLFPAEAAEAWTPTPKPPPDPWSHFRVQACLLLIQLFLLGQVGLHRGARQSVREFPSSGRTPGIVTLIAGLFVLALLPAWILAAGERRSGNATEAVLYVVLGAGGLFLAGLGASLVFGLRVRGTRVARSLLAPPPTLPGPGSVGPYRKVLGMPLEPPFARPGLQRTPDTVPAPPLALIVVLAVLGFTQTLFTLPSLHRQILSRNLR